MQCWHGWVSLPPLSPARCGTTARMAPGAAGGISQGCDRSGAAPAQGRAGAGQSLRDPTAPGLLSRPNDGEISGSLQECSETIPWAQGVTLVKKKEGKIASNWISVLGSAIPGGTESVTGEG